MTDWVQNTMNWSYIEMDSDGTFSAPLPEVGRGVRAVSKDGFLWEIVSHIEEEDETSVYHGVLLSDDPAYLDADGDG